MGMSEMCAMLEGHFRLGFESQEDYDMWIANPRHHFEKFMKTATPLRNQEWQTVNEGLEQVRNAVNDGMDYLSLQGGEKELWEIYCRLRDAVNDRHEVLRPLVGMGEMLYSRIINIGWLYALVWQLPAVDPENRGTYHALGKTALAMFYMDQLWYRTDGGESDLDRWFGDNDYRKLNALHEMLTAQPCGIENIYSHAC